MNCLFDADADHSEEELKLLMQVLLEEAVKDLQVTDLALDVVSNYAGEYFGSLFKKFCFALLCSSAVALLPAISECL